MGPTGPQEASGSNDGGAARFQIFTDVGTDVTHAPVNNFSPHTQWTIYRQIIESRKGTSLEKGFYCEMGLERADILPRRQSHFMGLTDSRQDRDKTGKTQQRNINQRVLMSTL